MSSMDRKIIHGVRLGNVIYVPGMEDQLDAALATADVDRLIKQGALEGKWTGKTEEREAPADTAKASESEVDLSTLKKDELLAEAEARGVPVDSTLTKAEIIEAIESQKE